MEIEIQRIREVFSEDGILFAETIEELLTPEGWVLPRKKKTLRF